MSSTREKKAHPKFLKATHFVMQHVLAKRSLQTAALPEDRWIEKRDTKNRDQDYLQKSLQEWKALNLTREIDFFSWLDNKELQEEKENKNRGERQKYQMKFTPEGFVEDKEGKRINTSSLSVYIIDDIGQLFVAPSLKGQLLDFAHHRKVICSGMIKIVDGKITAINNHSDHYKPELQAFYSSLKKIPIDSFADKAEVHYSIIYDSPFVQSMTDLDYWKDSFDFLSASENTLRLTIRDFLTFAEEIEEHPIVLEKPLDLIDVRKNRMAITLFESLLAKAILENPETWASVILKVDAVIFEQLKAALSSDDKLKERITCRLEREFLNDVPKEIKGEEKNTLTQMENWLLKNNSIDCFAQTMTFRKFFAEDIFFILPKNPQQDKVRNAANSYRKSQYFGGYERGRDDVWGDNVNKRELGIMFPRLGVSPPKEFKNYFGEKLSWLYPTKYRCRVTDCYRDSIQKARAARKKYDTTLSFIKQVDRYYIPAISGSSGTVSYVVPLLETLLPDLTREERKTFLMILAASLVAYGHHSFFEVICIANNNATYDDTFYTEQVLTPEFKRSRAYKKFREDYNNAFDKMIAGLLPTKRPEKIPQEMKDLSKHPFASVMDILCVADYKKGSLLDQLQNHVARLITLFNQSKDDKQLVNMQFHHQHIQGIYAELKESKHSEEQEVAKILPAALDKIKNVLTVSGDLQNSKSTSFRR